MAELRARIFFILVCVSVGVRALTPDDPAFVRKPVKQNGLPLVMWHGMGDSCCDVHSTGMVVELIEDRLGTFVYSINTGSSEFYDRLSSFFGNVNDQVAMVCATLRDMPELAGGFNAIGFSQGGQFMRAVVQRCAHTLPPIHTLVTLGAQHQGVMSTPGCPVVDPSSSCSLMQRLVEKGAYLPYLRSHVVQAQYFKDPENLKSYLKYNPFLPDINNELEVKNDMYKTNLLTLDQLILVRFRDDITVVPRDSSWFSFFNGTTMIPLQDQELWTQDLLGLKALNDTGRLHFPDAPFAHMRFKLDWFLTDIVDKYLK